MRKKFLCLLLISSMLVAKVTGLAWTASTISDFTDIPEDHWSFQEVNTARKYGIMEGIGDGLFGFGRTITKAEFVTVLNRMLGWEPRSPETPSISDVGKDKWYYSSVETALEKDVIDRVEFFYPDAPITREEMAVMMIRALGYKTLAEAAAAFENPFTDVVDKTGYITIASDIGMTKGTGPSTFSPEATAKREEAAAMLLRIYEKYIGKVDWVHGFYAISSYSQKELTSDMDAVSLGWSRMSYSDEQGVYLNTTIADHNEWNIPSSYENIISYFRENGTKTHLNVYMDTSTMVTLPDGSRADICSAIMMDPLKRSQAVNAIIKELTIAYQTIGYNPYSGVTIDFEGMKGDLLKEGFNAFLTELSSALKQRNQTLYVAVHPVTVDGIYYDAYDYRTIGQLADKVILMAHDYHVKTMPENLLNSTYYNHTPLTPFNEVYYSFKAITDENKGVEDRDKIVLAISFSSVGWKLQDSKLSSTESVKPVPSTIYSRLKEGAQMGYSETYRNPYMTYRIEDGSEIFLWYEDERSIKDKIELARLFGIKSVSLWRLGLIPAYPDEGLYYNVPESIK